MVIGLILILAGITSLIMFSLNTHAPIFLYSIFMIMIAYGVYLFIRSFNLVAHGKVYTMLIVERKNELNYRIWQEENRTVYDLTVGGWYFDGNVFHYTHVLITNLLDHKYQIGKFIKIKKYKKQTKLASNKVYTEPTWLDSDTIKQFKSKLPGSPK